MVCQKYLINWNLSFTDRYKSFLQFFLDLFLKFSEYTYVFPRSRKRLREHVHPEKIHCLSDRIIKGYK